MATVPTRARAGDPPQSPKEATASRSGWARAAAEAVGSTKGASARLAEAEAAAEASRAQAQGAAARLAEVEAERRTADEARAAAVGRPAGGCAADSAGISDHAQLARGAVAALEEALQRQNEAGERREQVLKKQQHVALLGQRAHHSAELARRDDQIAQLQEVVATLQQQAKRQRTEILRLRRQVATAAAPAADRDRDSDRDRDRDRALAPVGQTVVDAPGAVPGAVASAQRRWSGRRILLTIAVCLVVPCAFSAAVPGGAYTLHTAVAILSTPVLCVLVAVCGLGALCWSRNKAHNASCCASRAKRE